MRGLLVVERGKKYHDFIMGGTKVKGINALSPKESFIKQMGEISRMASTLPDQTTKKPKDDDGYKDD